MPADTACLLSFQTSTYQKEEKIMKEKRIWKNGDDRKHRKERAW
jgi:hypothetical protein